MGDVFVLCSNLNNILYTDFFDETYYHNILEAISRYFGAGNVRIILSKNRQRPDDVIQLNDLSDSNKTVRTAVSEDVSIEIVRPSVVNKKALLYIARYIDNILKFGEKITELQTDKLTGLMNNNTLLDLTRDKTMRHDVGVMFLDANDLRKLNNTEGHEAGDKLLITLADCMRSSIRKRELFRKGGDEFIAICQNIPQDVFMSKVENIRKAIAATPYSAAIGAIYKKECDDLDKMIKTADGLMYIDKAATKAAKADADYEAAIRAKVAKDNADYDAEARVSGGGQRGAR